MDELLEFCARILGDRDAAAEAAQSAAEDAGADPMQRLRCAVTKCRKRRNGATVVATDGSPPADGLAAAVAAELAAATARLPPRQQEALALRELLGLSHRQLGDVLGIEPTAVALLLARSRLHLRTELRGATIERSDCPEHDRMLCTATLRQDGENVGPEDDDWFVDHLGHCTDCIRAHSAMLEASVCYRGWRVPAA